MDFHVQDKQIQKKIDWISSQIRETKIQLKRQYKELEDAIKEQEKLRKKKKRGYGVRSKHRSDTSIVLSTVPP
ncbi:hypothetical protein LCGC14_0918210 [marine sediment metagenome]|uniref:Uncharacterized protein n=1 Tax=marine sediment metagenome TaxID=412755 RepID=A0A0F9NWC0_9ZZZZ